MTLARLRRPSSGQLQGCYFTARGRHSEESTVAAPERWGAASSLGAFGPPLAKQEHATFFVA